MRKRQITASLDTIRSSAEGWLDIGRVAVVEITSEEKEHPVESAFASGERKAGVPQNRDSKPFGSFLTSRKG